MMLIINLAVLILFLAASVLLIKHASSVNIAISNLIHALTALNVPLFSRTIAILMSLGQLAAVAAGFAGILYVFVVAAPLPFHIFG